jgi:hypothetical protein
MDKIENIKETLRALLFDEDSEYEIVKKKKKPEITWEPWMIDELKKCRESVIYFAENYCNINTIDGGQHLIDLFSWQKMELLNWTHQKQSNTCCSRQIGASTIQTIFALHQAIFNKGHKVVILTNREQMAKEMKDRIKRIYRNLPHWMKSGVPSFSKNRMDFCNESVISCNTTNTDDIRGQTVNTLIIDNIDYTDTSYTTDIFCSILPMVSAHKKSKIIICGTPNPYNPDSIQSKLSKQYKWNTTFYRWYCLEHRDEKWKSDQLCMLNDNQAKWDQEYELKSVV